ncbi:MAG: hypothetical protein K1X88_31390 [Nannocystaceae bacterium]|nr:hypothetical protein [Nannocystaceae bacterium]
MRAGLIRLIAALLCVCAWLHARPSAAQERHGVVTLDLRPTAGGTPTHLCVVSESKSERARDRLWDLLEEQPEKVGAAGGVQTTAWRVRPKAWDGADDSVAHQQCAQDIVGDCRPRVELPTSLTQANDFYAACTFDSLADGGAIDDPRPLFVLLEHLEGSPPRIESIRLAGGVATIGVGADLDRVVVTARSLGGAYLPHARSERGSKEQSSDVGPGSTRSVLVVLPLRPRCQIVELTLPRTTLQPDDRGRLSVRAHGVALDVDKCVGPLLGNEVLQLRLPQAPLGVGSIDVELRASGGRPAARFGARYDGAWPERIPFALRFEQVSFRWRRPSCIYPNDRCPAATLANGIECVGTPTKTGCDYRCPGTVDSTSIDLDLPVEVTFEKTSPVQRWQDTLAHAGQTLSSYVDADKIHLDANVSDWDTDTPDNQISRVEIFGEDGTAKQYGVTHVPNLQLKVPGASCEPVRYRPVGDRSYDEGIANVANGRIEFGPPYRTARRVGFNVTLAIGGGPAWTSYAGNGAKPPLYFSGLGMFAIELRPRKPKLSRLAVEFRMGGTLGRYAVVKRGDEDTTTSTSRDTGWARLLFEPGLVFAAHQRLAIGVGLGLGMSLPFRRQEDIASDRLRFIASPNFDFRFRVRRWLRLVLQFRGVVHEQPFQLGTPSDPFSPKHDTAGSFITLAGVQASF